MTNLTGVSPVQVLLSQMTPDDFFTPYLLHGAESFLRS